jgi:hypothetical protein
MAPAVKVDDTWEETRKRCEGPEFDALTEDERFACFERVIKRLKVGVVLNQGTRYP